jgi:hypothetical protein
VGGYRPWHALAYLVQRHAAGAVAADDAPVSVRARGDRDYEAGFAAGSALGVETATRMLCRPGDN